MKSQFLRYALVGLFGTVIHFSLMVLAAEHWGWDPLVAATLGFLAAFIASYLINKRWTFASGLSHATSAWRYGAVSLLGLGVNSALLALLVYGFSFWYVSAQLAVIMVVPIMNFGLNRYWTFKAPDQ